MKQPILNQVLPSGLQFRLSNGEEGAKTRIAKPEIKGDPLSEYRPPKQGKRIIPKPSAGRERISSKWNN